MPNLTILPGTAGETSMRLEAGTYFFGRDSSNSVQIDRPSVSGIHCEVIVLGDGRIQVRDLDSSNGTSINREPVSEGILQPGDTLNLGDVEILYEPCTTVPVPTGSPPIESLSFFRLIPAALGYPIKGDAAIVMVVIAVAQILPMFLPGILRIAGILIGFFLGCYIFAFIQDIILTTARGDDELPKCPEFMFEREEILELIWKFYVPVVFCFGPAILCRIWASDLPAWLLPVLYGLGAAYFPMAILGVIMSDDFAALNPIYVIPAILRAPMAYLVIVAIMGGFIGLTAGVDFGSASHLRSQNQSVGLLISAFAGIGTTYVSFVLARSLGLFYRCYEKRLGWFRE